MDTDVPAGSPGPSCDSLPVADQKRPHLDLQDQEDGWGGSGGTEPAQAISSAQFHQNPEGSTDEDAGSEVRPRPPGEPKLCGYLQKQAGPLRAWKLRWFSYEEKKNQLFYYRAPHDVAPLGRVELDAATFTYPLEAEGGTFHINTPQRIFVLKAASQNLMLYWLRRLQAERWRHGPGWEDNSNAADEFLPMLQSPVGLVGQEAAAAPTQRRALSSMSIKHPLIHIQNSVHSLRKRTCPDSSQSQFYTDVLLRNGSTEASEGISGSADDITSCPAAVCPAEAPAPSGRRGQGSPSHSEVSSGRTPSSEAAAMKAHLQQEKQMLVEEVKVQKELVWMLQKALEASQPEGRSNAACLEEEADSLRRRLADRDAQVAELEENIRLLTEENAAKQQLIMTLSDQVNSCLSDSASSGSAQNQNLKKLQQQIENLKDDIDAYRTQNQFLNSEMFQLTRLWRKSSEQENNLMVKCAYLEASGCRAESRYLGVLRRLADGGSLAAEQQDAVRTLIQDALTGGEGMRLDGDRDYDEYGFKVVPDYEIEDVKLLAKIQALEIRSHNLLQQDRVERPLLGRWEQYLAGRSDQHLRPSPELKALLRSGIPREYRQRVWRRLIRTRTRTVWEQHPQRYQQLCEKSRASPHPASRQIQLDLHRTLTTNQSFCSPSSPALQQLRRILLAFSWQNPAVGYCQGLNRLAAIALLVLQNEEDAFWCLVAVVEFIMPQDYYTKNLVASQADQRVLKDFMAEKLPRLAAHFEAHAVDVSLVTFNWFLVAFVESLPSDLLLPLWDAFLYEGTKVIFRYALALFKYKEEELLRIQDGVELYQYLRFFTKTVSDSRKLAAIAFYDMNPFPRRLLRSRHALHLERLQGELLELEEQQRAFVTESAERKDKELEVASEDDDEH